MKLDKQLLAAVFQATPKNDAREALNGVRIEQTDSGVRYVATDGHVLLCAWHSRADDCDTLPVTLPHAAVSQAIRGRNGTVHLCKTGAVNDGARVLSLNGTECKEITVQFPDYRLVVPSKISGKRAQFDPFILVRIARCANILHDVKPTAAKSKFVLHYNGQRAAFVTFGLGHAVGLVMPVRSKDDDDDVGRLTQLREIMRERRNKP